MGSSNRNGSRNRQNQLSAFACNLTKPSDDCSYRNRQTQLLDINENLTIASDDFGYIL